MGLFNRKNCDICGGDMGLIIDNKAADGNYCHNCAHKLSPFFKNARNSTLAQIQQQIAYRETNRQQLNIFNPTKVLGYDTKVYLDPGHNCFVVSKKSDYRSENADIINLSQVQGAVSEVKEHKKELYQRDAQGHNVSYNPKRYEFSYEIQVTIRVNSPYFNEIKFDVTKEKIANKASQEFMNYQHTADEIVAAVTGKAMPQNNVGGVAGAIGQAVAGAAGIAGLAGIAGALLGNQNANQQVQQGFNNNQNGYAQQGFNNNQGFAQQSFNNQGYAQQDFNNQGYAQQGFNNNGYAQQGFNNNGYAQQGFNNNGYAQQGFNNNNGYAQQGFNNNQGYAQQGFNNNGYAQQGFNNNQGFAQGFGGQWVCSNCGTTNTGNVCQCCGQQRM